VTLPREPRGPDPFLDWKVRVFLTGAVLLLAGIFLGRRELVGVAVVVLLAGLLLRVLQRYRNRGGG
jgi:hypothetical protein